MDDMLDTNGAGRIAQPPSPEYDLADWVPTDLLETELFNAIMADSSAASEENDFVEDYDCLRYEDGYQDEADQRKSELRVLSTLRPQLAELFGGPPT